uniref:Uncharacterized protein n=1 Tax=Molossus molossus TaxID=27622 RepID=A0A7J8IAD4_MOLMO|nr:hypothetical protein HJG59_013181 [Molossus molossus]
MPEAKEKTRRQKFGYNVNRHRLSRNALDGRQRHGSSAPSSEIPETMPNPCGRTWPTWDWPRTSTRHCPSVRERPWRWSLRNSCGNPRC